MNTYEEYQASLEKRKGYRVLQVAYVYLALDLLFFGNGWVSTLTAVLVGGGIGTALSKNYGKTVNSGGQTRISVAEWRQITTPAMVHAAVYHFVSTFLQVNSWIYLKVYTKQSESETLNKFENLKTSGARTPWAKQ